MTFPLHRIVLVGVVIALWLVLGHGLPGMRQVSYWQETQPLKADLPLRWQEGRATLTVRPPRMFETPTPNDPGYDIGGYRPTPAPGSGYDFGGPVTQPDTTTYSYDTFTPGTEYFEPDYDVVDTYYGNVFGLLSSFLSPEICLLIIGIIAIAAILNWRLVVEWSRDARCNAVESFGTQLDLLREERQDQKPYLQIAWRIAKLLVMPVGAGFWTSTGAPGLKRFWRGPGY